MAEKNTSVGHLLGRDEKRDRDMEAAQNIIRLARGCREIYEHYGFASQVSHTIQECAELIAELTRYDGGDDSRVIDELADVAVMVLQLSQALGAGRIMRRMGYKIEREKGRINAAE